jgi:hypothetical protein
MVDRKQMFRSFKKLVQSHPISLVFAAVLWGAVFVFSDGVVSPYVKDSTSLSSKILGMIIALTIGFFFLAFSAGGVLLLRRKWLSGLCCVAVAFILYASLLSARLVRGDRFMFTGAPHNEIAKIYNRNPSQYSDDGSGARLTSLRDDCGPPNGCACWVVVDSKHSSGVDKEIGSWHTPNASIFPRDTLPRQFVIVDVRQISQSAYSILGCEADWTAWKPV